MTDEPDFLDPALQDESPQREILAFLRTLTAQYSPVLPGDDPEEMALEALLTAKGVQIKASDGSRRPASLVRLTTSGLRWQGYLTRRFPAADPTKVRAFVLQSVWIARLDNRAGDAGPQTAERRADAEPGCSRTGSETIQPDSKRMAATEESAAAELSVTRAGQEAEQADETAGQDAAQRPPLSDRAKAAYDQYLRAVPECTGKDGRKPTDQQCYDWLKAHNDGDMLPAFDTWQRYVRQARQYLGEQKNTPRAGRRPGRSIVSAQDIEPPKTDEAD